MSCALSFQKQDFFLRRVLLLEGTLIGRLLVRMMLKERGLEPKRTSFSATAAGKPYIVGWILDIVLSVH